ncbi:hypothetical protein ACVWZ4_004658 [Bradyrhizobium sp. USDA 4472]
MNPALLVKAALAYFSLALSLYWTWRFFKISYPHLITSDAYSIGVYGRVGLASWALCIICLTMCYFSVGAIASPMSRLLIVAVVGAVWGAILFVNLYFGWLGITGYSGSLFW